MARNTVDLIELGLRSCFSLPSHHNQGVVVQQSNILQQTERSFHLFVKSLHFKSLNRENGGYIFPAMSGSFYICNYAVTSFRVST